jgi:uncharacterized protein YgfB (UPF0149 family)
MSRRERMKIIDSKRFSLEMVLSEGLETNLFGKSLLSDNPGCWFRDFGSYYKELISVDPSIQNDIQDIRDICVKVRSKIEKNLEKLKAEYEEIDRD